MDLTLDLWTFDVGFRAGSPEAWVDAVVRRVEQSWDSGADIVVLPEFMWMGLEPLLSGGLKAVAHTFWTELLPGVAPRLARHGKAVVLGTAPFLDTPTSQLLNRAPIFADGRALQQDKLHLTPWEKDFTPGASLQLWRFMGLRIAVIICLDIEIPELAARLRGLELDLILCPSATETPLGVERVNRCASARAVELGCCVGVAHLVGNAQSDLIDQNIGRVAFYRPSQAAFGKEPRWVESEVVEKGFVQLRTVLPLQALIKMRRMRTETNPALLGGEAAGISRHIPITYGPEDP